MTEAFQFTVANLIVAAERLTAPELKDHGGAYLLDCQVAIPVADDKPRFGHAPWAYDRPSAELLWAKTEALTGVRFD